MVHFGVNFELESAEVALFAGFLFPEGEDGSQVDLVEVGLAPFQHHVLSLPHLNEFCQMPQNLLLLVNFSDFISRN